MASPDPIGRPAEAAIAPPAAPARVLVIHAYHPGLSWTDGVQRGLTEVFEAKHVEVHTEYLDTKRYRLAEVDHTMAGVMRAKYAKAPPDVVLTSDNHALEFARRHRETLFPGVPKVFCGINDYRPALIEGMSHVTGVAEATSPRRTFELMRELRPDLQRVVVLGDGTTTGGAELAAARAALGSTRDGVTLEYVEVVDFDATLDRLGGLDRETDAVLLTVMTRDVFGRFYPFEASGRRVAEASAAPVFGLWDFYLGTGVVGGHMADGEAQGRTAARLAMRVIEGQDVEPIPVELDSPNRLLVDHAALKRFDIDPDRVPAEATVVNRPPGLWRDHRRELGVLAGVMLGEAVAMVMLGALLWRGRRRSEHRLRVAKERFDELCDHSRTVTWETDAQGWVTYVNHVVKHVLGADDDDWVGKVNLFEPGPKARPGLSAAIRNAISHREPFSRLTNAWPTPTDVVWLNCDGVPRFDAAGVFLGYRGSFTDVTEEYEARHAVESMQDENAALREALDAHTVFSITDTRGKILEVNDAFCELSGYSREELVGQDHRLVNSGVHERDFWSQMWRTVADGKAWRGEVCNRAKDGTLYWVDTTNLPRLDRRGKVISYISLRFDVTARKRAEAKLDRLAKRLELATNAAGVGIWDFDLLTSELVWDETMHRIFGTDPETDRPSYELWVSLVHDEDREQTVAEFQHAIESRQHFETTFRIRRPAGEVRHVHAAATVTEDDHGKARRVVGVNIDVTESTRALQRVEENQARLREIFDGLFGFLGLLSPDGVIEDVNRAALEVSGLALSDVEGVAFAESYWWQHDAELRERVAAACADARAGRIVRFEATYRETGDRLGHVDVTIGPLYGPDGRIERILAFCVDVTDRVVAQNRLDLAIRAGNIGLWDWSLDTDETYFSDSFYTMLGYEPGELPMCLDTWKQLAHEDDIDGAIADVERHLRGETTAYINEHRLRRKDGTWQWIRDVGEVVERHPNGQPKRLIGVHVDVDRLVTTQQHLEAAREEAEAASLAKSAFLANMSHEIRTPMTAILGYTNVILDPAASALDFTENVYTIQRNAQHLLCVINDILDVSKIEAGKMTVEQIDTDPVTLLEDVASLVRPSARSKGFDLHLRYDTPMPAAIRSDPTRLKQVLLNLTGNAVKFTNAGSVTIRVACQPDRRVMVYRVIDTGTGMSPQQLDTVRKFESFNQGDSSTTRRFGGTGLGLRISSLLAEALGGGIGIESQQGRGSTFTLTVGTGDLSGVESRDVQADAAPRLSAAAAPDAAVATRPLSGIRVLLAEDGEDNRRLISFLLKKAGAEVVTANDGRAAVRAVEATTRREAFHVVLMDMQMPELDGYGATRLLRERGFTLPIVAVTAHAMAGDRQGCLDAGCDDYLSKPIDPAGLVETCRRLGVAEPAGGDAANPVAA